jgi:phosphatidate cytidylyltransferase
MAMFHHIGLMKRVASAVVLIPLTLFVIWSGGWLFAIFCALGAAITFYEWRAMVIKLPMPMVYVAAGAFYIGVAGISFYFLRETFPFKLSVIFITLVWASDSGAYFTGKALKGPKLAPQISPNKTWAGFAGALVFPALLAVLYASFYKFSGHYTPADYWVSYGACFTVGLLIGALGQGGDLLVSYFKRQSGIKDTGNLIPGHGGILDRIDSLLPNLPFFYGVALLVKTYVLV